jgi:hypothetical protein
MIEETLTDSQIVTRVKRAFGWVVTFRDVPKGCEQRVIGTAMMTEAITYCTKGTAELYLNDQRQPDRVPGILSSDQLPRPDAEGKIWKLVYVEPCTRVCIPDTYNKGRLPNLTKIELVDNQSYEFPLGFKGLVCLGKLVFDGKEFNEEQQFQIKDIAKTATAQGTTYILDFTNA